MRTRRDNELVHICEHLNAFVVISKLVFGEQITGCLMTDDKIVQVSLIIFMVEID